MSYCGKKLSKHGLLILPAVVLFSGCGLDINSGDSTTAAQSRGSEEQTVAIAGAAMKGVIQQGLVTANRLIPDKDGYYAPQRQAARSRRPAPGNRQPDPPAPPLTHLAVALAERSANGLSPDALSGSYQTVEGWFGLAAGSLRVTPPDLTRLDESDSVSADALASRQPPKTLWKKPFLPMQHC